MDETIFIHSDELLNGDKLQQNFKHITTKKLSRISGTNSLPKAVSGPQWQSFFKGPTPILKEASQEQTIVFL